jgi:AcrR family transcriptional regulator
MPDSGHFPDEAPRMAELLDIAARLFNEQGYHATSLAEIGEELGMNKASLYHYVKSKNDLLARVIYRASQRLRQLAEGIGDDTDDALAALLRLVETHCNTLLDHPNEFGTVIIQRRYMSADILPDIADRERAYFDAAKDLIDRGIESGVFRKSDPSVTAQILLDAMNGILRWYRPAGRLTRDKSIAEVVAFARQALGAEKR